MKGKDKCKALKEIRRQIAETNDIPYVVSQCTHKGDCKGTCPKCEAELKYLERELARRQKVGKAAAVVGISMGVCSTLSGCAATDIAGIPLGIGQTAVSMLEGDVAVTDGVLPMEPETIDIPVLEGETTINLPEEETEEIVAGQIEAIPDEEIAGRLMEESEAVPNEEIADGMEETETWTLEGDISVAEDFPYNE